MEILLNIKKAFKTHHLKMMNQ